MAEYVVTTIRTLLEAESNIRRLLTRVRANLGDSDLARQLYLNTVRAGKELVVTLGSTKHVISDWHDSGQITTTTLQAREWRPQRRYYNHSSWEGLTDSFSFTVDVE